jgi:tRNA/rRNA methyltransferase
MTLPGTRPAVILVEPQMGENVGSAARAMANFGLKDLRLVRPRFRWPSARAEALSVGAFEGPAAVTVSLYDEVAAALADRTYVLAATARPRETRKPVRAPREALDAVRAALIAGGAPGVMFGSEQAGLDNDAVALADAIVTYPVNPLFSSLNLAQAVMVFAYEWGVGEARPIPEGFKGGPEAPAPREELQGLTDHLEGELEDAGFFWPPIKAEHMKRNLKSTFARAQLTAQEVQTLRGAIKALVNGPRRRYRELKAREEDASRAAPRPAEGDPSGE